MEVNLILQKINNVAKDFLYHIDFKDELRSTKKSVPHIVRSSVSAAGYRLIHEPLARQNTTMVPQSYNKINPFVTEKNKAEVKHLIDMIS